MSLNQKLRGLRMANGGELMRRFAAQQTTLRAANGGDVPGTGSGDKVPALYEPGEFVVSNDMLDAAPQLRGQLRDLRGNVLAAKGMTSEQADAKALAYDGPHSGGQDGQGQHSDRRGGSGEAHGGGAVQAGLELGRGTRTGLRGQLDGTGVLGRGASAGLVSGGGEQPRSRLALRANDGFEFDPSKYTPPKVDPKTGVYSAGAAPVPPMQPDAPPTAAKPAGTFGTPKYSALRKAGSMLDSVGSGAKGIYGGVKSVGPGIAAGVAGGFAADQAQSIGDPSKTPNGQGPVDHRADGIPTGLGPQGFAAPAKQPHNWFTDSETGRNVGNTVSALSGVPVVGTLGNTLRAAGAARAATALPVAGAALIGANESIKASRTQPSAPTLREPNPYEAANAAKLAQADAQEQARPPSDDGQAQRTADRNAQTQKDIALGNQMQADRLAREAEGYAAQDRQQAVNQTLSDKVDQERAAQRAQSTLGSIMDTPAARAQKAAAAQTLRDIGGRQLQGDKDRAEGLRSSATNAANLKIHAAQNQTTLRGQDLDYAGKLATNSLGMRNALREQANKDREFSAGRDDANFTQRQAAQKQAVDDIADSLPPVMVDGKPTRDLAGAAQHLTAQNRLVAEQITKAEAHMKLNPDDARMANVLEGLKARNLAMLGPEAKKRVAQGVNARNMVNETATGAYTPWGTSAVATNDPVTSLRKRGGDYITQTGDVIPKRYVEKDGSVMGFGGRPSLRYDDLIAEGARLDSLKK